MQQGIERKSLGMRTAEAIRAGIENGVWEDTLPAELSLSKHLGVSRTVLRQALKMLVAEGVVGSGRGLKRRILRSPTSGNLPLSEQICVLILPHQMIEANSIVLRYICELYGFLQSRGVRLEIVSVSSLHAFRKCIVRRDVSVWILNSVHYEYHRLAQQHNLRAIISGVPRTDIQLSSFDLDYRAIAHHSACQLFRLGHQHISVALPEPMLGGDEQAANGVLDATDSMGDEARTASLLLYSAGPVDFGKRLTAILRRSNRPTAIIIRNLADALLVYEVARQEGLAIPNDLSVIALNDFSEMDYLAPPLVAYRHNYQITANRLGRAVVRLLDPCVRKPFHIRVTAERVRADSICRPPGNEGEMRS